MLAPHDGVQRQLGGGGAAAEDVADLLVLVVGEAELLVGLLDLGGLRRDLDGVLVAHARAPRSGGCPVERGHDRGEEAEPVGGRAGQRVDGVLRVRHQADDVAFLVADARDVAGWTR